MGVFHGRNGGACVDVSLKDVVKVVIGYFAVFFAIMLAYRYIQAEFVKHVPFEFDLVQNLAVPAFAGMVGGVTKGFGGRR